MSNKRYEVNTPGVSPVDRDVTKLLYVSTAKYGGDWHSLMHTHACTELFYVVGGMGQFKVAEKLIPVSPDDLVIVNPNVEHTEVSLNASPLEYIVLGVEGMEFAADENGDRRYSAFNFHSGREDILPYCCFSKRMRKVFRKNEKSMLQNCNKKAKRKGRLQRVKKPM